MFFFFFFKQKTAYEMLRSLVGSEMCIRDRYQRRVRGSPYLSPMVSFVARFGSMVLLAAITSAAVHQMHFSNHNGKHLANLTAHVAAGDTVMVSFYGLLSTGYSWSNRTHPRHLHLTESLRQEVPPNNYVWNYTADTAGEDKLFFVFGKPWLPAPDATVTATVHVEDANQTSVVV
eukprot:TRINITY_DN26207_c0_g1_i1.p1 TRINITY_DN26207_c0_g1~~TRINITY_DN26207_c0_g1_i1.p1  ORF type:complete len:175 (+),score=52.35 TRINITY_DN26207_c0_g1_i1:97-621(+)